MSSKLNVSVVVPCFNEEQFISQSLTSIIEQANKYDGKVEIVVVDNCSTDNTASIAKSFPVTVLTSNASSPAAVRNLGAEKTSYPILAFIDGDCVIPSNWFDKLNCAYQDSKVAAYGGQCLAPQNDPWVSSCWNPTTVKSFRHDYEKLLGGNFTIRKTIFEQLGGFNSDLVSAEDDELSKRVMSAGYKCVLHSDATVIHLGYPTRLTDVYSKQKWHGATQIKAHGFFGDKLVLVTYAWILGLLLMIAGVTLSPVFGLLGGSLLCVCLVAVTLNRMKVHSHFQLRNFILGNVVALFFITGRAVGLFKELMRK